jgi:hypothetical protein
MYVPKNDLFLATNIIFIMLCPTQEQEMSAPTKKGKQNAKIKSRGTQPKATPPAAFWTVLFMTHI